jgi:hypothetical protein
MLLKRKIDVQFDEAPKNKTKTASLERSTSIFFNAWRVVATDPADFPIRWR